MTSNSNPQVNLPADYNGVGYPGNVPFVQLLPDLFLGYLTKAGGLDSSTNATSPTNPAIATALKAALNTTQGSGSISMQNYLTIFFTQPQNINTAFPSSIQQFMNTFLNANGLPSETETQLQSNPIYVAFKNSFDTVLQTGTDFSSPNETDTQLFESAFDDFLNTYPVTSSRSYTQPPASAETNSSGQLINPNPSTPNPNAIAQFAQA